MHRLNMARHAPLLTMAAVAACSLAAAVPMTSSGPVHYIGYEQARPVIEALNENLPDDLKSLPAQNTAAAWDGWVVARDRQIRSRLEQGDEDSLVNFLLFGTSFTKRKRLTLEFLAEVGRKQAALGSAVSPEGAELLETVRGRADDLVRGAREPGANERLLFARHFMERKGYGLADPLGRSQAKDYLLASFARVLNDQAKYAESLENARKSGSATDEFAQRSTLYKDRGLSSDTSLLPDFAISQSLGAMKARGLLALGQMRSVAVVGPGLDFTDKEDGYDFYPQQTVQPFAVIDSLVRLGLSTSQDLRVTTLDLSPRINEHLAGATDKARRGVGYTVQMPFDRAREWKPELTAYWKVFGDQIGSEVTPAAVPPAFGNVRVRAVQIKPLYVAHLDAVDLNIVLQRLELDVSRKFDLIIATNILVYYDTFEQSLALANIASMLKPRGWLLCNNGLTEIPSIPMHSMGYLTVVYSNRPGDGDHIVWYRRE